MLCMKNYLFIILNVPFIYSFHLILKSFLPCRTDRKKRILIYYSLFYLVNTTNYIFINKPVLNLIGFLCCFLLIEYTCYKGNAIYKALIGSIICVCSFLIEMASAYFVAIFYEDILKEALSDTNYTILMIVISKFILFTAGLILSGRRNPGRYEIKAPYYWSMFSLVPICGLFLIFCFYMGEGRKVMYVRNILFTITIVLIFILNIAVYGLLDLVIKEFQKRTLYEIELSKVAAYKENGQIMRKHQLDLERYRHDVKRALVLIKKNALNHNDNAILKIVDAEIKTMYELRVVVNTGYTEIDNIINHKMSYAESLGIKSSIIILLGSNTLSCDEEDLCILIGNLLDNMIESCASAETSCTGAVIRFEMESIQGNIHIAVFCPIRSAIKFSAAYQERCKVIQSIANKYNGIASFENIEGLFQADILLMKK